MNRASRRWHGLELRHLRTLVAVAESGSFSGAAALLGYVQSSVSYNVTALEESVGLPLVDRRRGGSAATLSPAGQALLGYARRILAEVERAEESLSDAGPTRLVVATTPDVAPLVLSDLHAAASESARAVHCLELSPGEARRALARDDLLGVFEPLDDSRLAYRPLARDRFVFVEQAQRRRRLGPVGPAELAGRGLVLHSARSAAHLRALDLQGIPVRVEALADSDASTLVLVARGAGCALVPELALGRGHPLHVRPLGPGVGPAARVVAAAWRRGRELTPAESELVDRLAARLTAPSRLHVA